MTSSIQSTAGHVKSRGKMGGPSSKPKYYPGRGVKENLKPCAYKHLEHVKV